MRTASAATGLLVIWTGVQADAEADFNDWYDKEHLAERVGVPGFLNGRRYLARTGFPRYLAWYETETPDVLGSAAYGVRQANPTSWTQRIMPSFRDVTRVTATRLAKTGAGLGETALTLRIRPAAGRETALAAALVAATGALTGRPGVVAAQSFRPSAADAAAGTTEARLRAAHEAPPAWGLILEAISADAAEAAFESTGLDAVLKGAAGAAGERGVYDLLSARGEF